MNNPGNKISWRQLREFADVDLTKSFVLSWHVEAEALIVDIDLYLEPEHPFYERPRPAEKVCIRPAYLEFPYCEQLALAASDPGEVPDIAKQIGHGAILDLCVPREGFYEIHGEFGTVSIAAERPLLRLDGPWHGSRS